MAKVKTDPRRTATEVVKSEDYALKNVTEGLAHVEDRVQNVDNRLSNLIMRLTGETCTSDVGVSPPDEGFLPATNSSIDRITDIIEAAVVKLERIEYLTG